MKGTSIPSRPQGQRSEPKPLPAMGRLTSLALGALALAGVLPSPELVLCQVAGPTQDPTNISVPRFALTPPQELALAGPARSGSYAGVTGTRAAWLGLETGRGEVWVHPLKVVRNLGLSFLVPQYADPIPGERIASRVVVAPGHLQVDHVHEGFVVREHILAPRDLPGILILLEVDAVVELKILVEMEPVLQDAWPGGFGGQYLFWDGENRAFILSESLQRRNAVVGSPWAAEASAHPAHRLAEAPSVFVIPVDPQRAKAELIPIAIAAGAEPRAQVLDTYRELIARSQELTLELHTWGTKLARETFRFSASPDPDTAYGIPSGSGSESSASLGPLPLTERVSPAVVDWAKVNLAEQTVCNPDLGCGFVAGWGVSGTSFRPGFGWYFGGDAAINTLAMDATGQWRDVAQALRFLAGYQREDGKIPHEISQAAGTLPWFEEFPYAYYHADTTPYWMLALWHYWRASGDTALVQELWPAFLQAYRWCLSVETDGDGLIENTTGGLGAIEVGGLGEGIHQDIYLAAVWTEALKGVVELARARGDSALASEAEEILQRASSTLNRRYWMPDRGYHAFGILRGGGTNGNLTAWPATALGFGLLQEEEAEGTLFHLARETISAEWGARLLSTESDLYDPLHYNNGMVWPFMTGFVAWGQYRYRRPWAGFPLLEALWRLHGDWSPGRHPENLSGAYYQILDATVPHQFFASSMLVTPLARGLLGWEPDAPGRKATLAPQPHPDWGGFRVRNLGVGETRIHLDYRRADGEVDVLITAQGPTVDLTYIQSIPLGARNIVAEGPEEPGEANPVRGLHDIQHRSTFPVSEDTPVRLRFRWEGGLEVFADRGEEILPGSTDGGVRILDFTMEGVDWILTLEGPGGDDVQVHLRGDGVAADQGRVLREPGGRGDLLQLPLPEEGRRVVRTVRLRPIREESPDR